MSDENDSGTSDNTNSEHHEQTTTQETLVSKKPNLDIMPPDFKIATESFDPSNLPANQKVKE